MSLVQKFKIHEETPINKLVKVMLILMGALFATAVVFLVIFTIQVSMKFSDFDDSKVFNLAQNSKIYAADNETVLAELQIENREPVPSLDNISPNVMKATIAVEDARFYYHRGIDFFALFRAAGSILSGGNTQGGSTITMQLTRNTILTSQMQAITLERKISEMILATKIETIYDKDQILLMYLNTINYGDRCYGIKAASKHYFSLEPDQLSLVQAATLVGIPQSPTYLAPTNNPDACKVRRNLVLGRMHEDNVISDEDYQKAIEAPVELNVSWNDPSENYKYPYFTSYVREQILENYSDAEIFEGGFQIYTTLDIKHQDACELGCTNQNKKLEKGAESVAVTMDPSNGHITGMVGGDDYQTHQYNIATSKGRPTGSSFKIFTLATAIEQGYDPDKYTLDCTSPMNIGTVQIRNVGGASYGVKTIQGATAVSSNTGFVRLQQKVETQNVIDMARKLGIKEADLPLVTTLTLGVADINPVEMACAYATVANGGTYHEPVSILRIETASGEEIYSYDESENEDNGKQVIDEKVAGAITKTLKTVFTQGTATSAQLANKQPVAGKTGTSEDWRDHTLIGYTPKVVCSTWIGKRDYTPTSSNVTCNALFKEIMDTIHDGEEIVDFPEVESPEYTKTPENLHIETEDERLAKAPNVVGMSIDQAKAVLSAYNLAIVYQYSDTVPANIVMSQGVQDSRIYLTVSKGPNPTPPTPPKPPTTSVIYEFFNNTDITTSVTCSHASQTSSILWKILDQAMILTGLSWSWV